MLESPINTIELINSSTRQQTPTQTPTQIPTRVPDCGQTVAEDLFATVRCTITPDAIPIRLLLTSTEFPFMLGRYEVLSVLGQGEMGSVYLVYDTTLDRRVAMKIPALDEDNNSNDNIQNEARVMAGLHHPNLCPVHNFGVIDETPYLTMPFISGPTLSEKMAIDQLGIDEAVTLTRKIAAALEVTHQAGIIHRDLKPSNILIDSQDEPVIVDFGLAKSVHKLASFGDEGVMLGTPAYMPPEQAAGNNQAVGPTSDVYSLGVILFEMLTGQIPFQGELSSVLQQIVSDDAPMLSTFNPEVDQALEAICLTALSKLPGDRFASASAFGDELARWQKKM